MEQLYHSCCGIDVHKQKIVACLMKGDMKEIRTFGADTCDLRDMTNWLLSNNCEMVAMESTASYWKPLYNIFELSGLPAIVVNPCHMKNIPGRKTDVKDSEWIANLLRHGLLESSFIPEREQRELREVTRYRNSLVEERARELNRLQKMLEGANIKLGNVVSEILGVSSRNFLDLALRDDEPTVESIQAASRGTLKNDPERILRAIKGIPSKIQRELIRRVLDHIDDMTKRIEEMDDMLKSYIKDYEDTIKLIDDIPGIGRTTAEVIVAEIGRDMSRFPTAAHLCSWAGLSPGNNESAGKRKSGRINQGNRLLKKMLNQCANSIVHAKNNYFAAQFNHLVPRLGVKKAIVAVSHSILIAIYHVLSSGNPFNDLGYDYYNKINKEQKVKNYLKKLASLGVNATILSST